MDANEVFTWIAAGGSVAIVAWFASWFLEKLGWWQGLAAEAKQAIILAIALALGLLATWVLSLPPETLEKARAYIEAGLLVITAWLGTQTAHKANKT